MGEERRNDDPIWSYDLSTTRMNKKFEYRADLGAVPLAEILATIERYRVPGVVSVSREARLRKIFLDEGRVAFATSNERETGLGMYLLRHGLLSADSAREAEERRVRDGLPLGQILLQMGLITPEALNRAVAGQVRDILWGAFEWESGSVLFEIGPGSAESPFRIDLSISEVVLEAIRRAGDVRRLVQRLGHAHTVLEKTPGNLIGLFHSEEKAFYEQVDGKTPLQALCAKGPLALAENARLLYAFFCLGLVRKTRRTGSGAKKIQYRTERGTVG